MNILKKLNLIYASEINIRIESFWDSGYKVSYFKYGKNGKAILKEVYEGYDLSEGVDELLKEVRGRNENKGGPDLVRHSF